MGEENLSESMIGSNVVTTVPVFIAAEVTVTKAT
jgi:hypothetical protein